MKLDKYDIALANAAADEESLPVLTQICYKDGKLAAADGCMLICREADVERNDGFTDEQVLIPAKMAKQVKPTAKKPVKLTIKDKEITATYLKFDLEGEHPIDPKLQFKADLNAEFPKYEQLFPKGKKYYQYAISISLLRQLLTCLPKDGTLKMGFGKQSSDPMEFRVGTAGMNDQAYDYDRPIYGMLMPMFVDWDGDEWQRASKKENKEGEGNETTNR